MKRSSSTGGQQPLPDASLDLLPRDGNWCAWHAGRDYTLRSRGRRAPPAPALRPPTRPALPDRRSAVRQWGIRRAGRACG